MVQIVLDPFTLMLVLASGFIILTCVLVIAMYLIVSKKVRVTPAYLCGEDERDFYKSLSPGGSPMYWGATEVLKKCLKVLREGIHTGFIDDWFSLMIPFMMILVVVAVVVSLVFTGV
ncbi:MAG: hypothetical protein J7L12_00315 [Desulfurococcales archaeon]|nr:hypothetical protein [Desulfurococcales archaeon]